MGKRITTRTIVPVAVVMAAFITLCFILLYSYISSLMQDERIDRVSSIAKTVVKTISYDMLQNNHPAMEHYLSTVGGTPGVVHLRIFDKKGVIRFSKDKDELGTLIDLKAESCNTCHNEQETVYGGDGNERVRFFHDEDKQPVLGLSYPIPRQDGCATIQCHAGMQQSPLLGVVDVGMSQQDYLINMAGVAKVLIGFWFMVVLLSIGIVAAILQKNVLLPIDRLYRYVKQIRRGVYVEPELEDSYELEYIAEGIHELVEKVKKQ